MSSKLKYLQITLALALIIGAGSFVFSPNAKINFVDLKPEAQKNQKYKRVFFANFDSDIAKFRPIKIKTPLPAQKTKSDYFEIKGQQTFQGLELIPVDPNKLYYMKLEYNLPADQTATVVKLYAGVAMYDESKKPLNSKPGPFRYFVNGGKPLKVDSIGNNKWAVLSGIITDTDNALISAFRPGSRYVTPFIITNYKDENAVTRLRNIEILEFQ